MTLWRPHITLSYAQSIDGSLAQKPGKPFALSGPQAMQMTHQLRAEHQAILVGIGTVLADNPRLTVRLVAGPNPQPIILDSHLRCPVSADLVPRAWIITTPTAPSARQHALEARGAQVVRLPPNMQQQIALPCLLHWLKNKGIESVMVEGGSTILSSFLAEKLVDRLIITIAPLLLGGVSAITQLNSPVALHDVTMQQFGQDWVMQGRVLR